MPGRSAKPSQNSMHQSSATKRGRPKSDDPKQVVTIPARSGSAGVLPGHRPRLANPDR